MCPCRPGSLLAEAGAPCGARLAITEQSEVFGQVTPRCQAFNRQVWSQSLVLRGFTQNRGSLAVRATLLTLWAEPVLCSPMAPSWLCLSLFFLFSRRKKGTPRGRRKKAPLFRTKKPPSLPQPRTRRWRCQGRVATRRRWQRRRKVRQVRAVAGNVLSSAGFAARSQMSALTRGLSPQSHTQGTVSHSTRGILDACGFHACKECPGSLPSSRVCLDRWLFWEPFGF